MMSGALPLELGVERILSTVAATSLWFLLAVIVLIVIALLRRSLAEQGEG
jgi:surface polysaccharide O-acyltransferase-like enzyme